MYPANATATAATAAAKPGVRACAACGAALAVLWKRCQLALQHLFNGAATQNTAPCTCTCALAPSVPMVPAETNTADTDPAEIPAPAPTPTSTTTATAKDTADASEQLVATATQHNEDAPATDSTALVATTDDCVRATGLADEPEEEEEPTPTLALPQELAEHELAVDESIMARYRSQLMAKHAALGRTPVPSDTVLLIISWLLAQNRGHAFILAYPFAIVDIVLRALAWHDHDVAATVGGLARHWMRDYRCMRILRKHARTRRHEVDALRLELSTAYSTDAVSE